MVVLTVALAGCAAPEGKPAGPATGAVADPGGNPAGTGGWTSRTVRGLPAGSQLWDVAVSDSGFLVAVGTVGTGDVDGGLPLMIWRSADGFTWEELFRRIEELVDPEDASGPAFSERGGGPSRGVHGRGLHVSGSVPTVRPVLGRRD